MVHENDSAKVTVSNMQPSINKSPEQNQSQELIPEEKIVNKKIEITRNSETEVEKNRFPWFWTWLVLSLINLVIIGFLWKNNFRNADSRTAFMLAAAIIWTLTSAKDDIDKFRIDSSISWRKLAGVAGPVFALLFFEVVILLSH